MCSLTVTGMHFNSPMNSHGLFSVGKQTAAHAVDMIHTMVVM